MKQRIWELDAFRGLCILGVVIVHFVYDLTDLFGIIQWDYPDWFSFIKDWGGTLFFILSGICVTLGSRSVRRGLIVIGGGMLCTAATFIMYQAGFGWDIMIWFGVLHCLGSCMLLWPLFKKCPGWLLAILGAGLIWLGFYVKTVTVTSIWLIPLGFHYRGFASSDYFPLILYLGFFLLGAALGRTVYRNKQSLLPKISSQNILVRPLCFCGRHSLWIYLLHQPLGAGICYLLSM